MMSFRTTLSNLAKLSTTWGAYGLSATAELLVYSETVRPLAQRRRKEFKSDTPAPAGRRRRRRRRDRKALRGDGEGCPPPNRLSGGAS